MLKIAICEDNPIHSQLLKNTTLSLLERSCTIDTFSSSQEFQNSQELKAQQFDIVLMDIQLEDGSENGIALTQDINRLSPDTQIIFISQYLEYVSSVYETQHVYFISKDQLELYLPKALLAAVKNIRKTRQQYLYFKQKKRQIRILQNDILYMERVLRTTYIHTRALEEPYVTSEKFQSLLERLPPDFLLCHRSFLVNLNAVSTFSRENVTLLDGHTIPMGRVHYEPFKKAFARHTLNGVGGKSLQL